MHFRKISFAALMIAVSIYLLVPSADELLIHPATALLLSSTLHIPFFYALLVSIAIFRVAGLCFLFAAVKVSGVPFQQILKDMRTKIKYIVRGYFGFI